MIDPRSFLDGRVVLHHGDCREVLRTLTDDSVDSVVTDPPYHLTSIVKRFGGKNAAPTKFGEDGAFARASSGFMNKTWDGGDVAFQTDLWVEVLRILKPGGYVMAFSSCRTYHRMACAIEDAGFVTHPMFAWVFGSGFPKAHNVSKQIDKTAGHWRGQHGDVVIDEQSSKGREYERTPLGDPITEDAQKWDGWFYGTQSLKPAMETIYFGQKPFSEKTGAANVLRWGTGAINIGACKVPSESIKRTRNYVSGGMEPGGLDKPGERVFTEYSSTSRWPANLIHDGSDDVLAFFPDSTSSGGDGYKESMFYGGKPTGGHGLGDSGSAARFFYSPKADADDRLGSKHATVKPLDLIQYLVRLVTPPNGLVLDLFAGTGTTAEAAYREGFRSVLIEQGAESVADVERRMSLVLGGRTERKYASIKAKNLPRDDGPLFGGSEEPLRHPRATGVIYSGAEGPFGKDQE